MALAKIAPPPVPRLKWPRSVCPTPLTESNNVIGTDRIYDLHKVQELVRMHGVCVINDTAIENMQGGGRNPLPLPNWLDSDVANVILALTSEDYENSQWCSTSSRMAMDCDSYLIYYGRAKQARWAHGIKLYIKFGFAPNASNPKAVVCSIHPAKH